MPTLFEVMLIQLTSVVAPQAHLSSQLTTTLLLPPLTLMALVVGVSVNTQSAEVTLS
jgi:hypothetical protein